MGKKIENGVIVDIKRIGIDMPEELHNEIKVRATFRHESIRKWVLEAIACKIAQEDRFK